MTGSPESLGNPEVLQLKKLGDTATLRVTSCTRVKQGNYPEVAFVGVDAGGRLCAVWVPEKSADRQLERAVLTRESVVGQTITFTRSPNAQIPTKPFWDVVVAEAPIDAPQRVPQSAVPQNGASAASQSAPHASNGNGSNRAKKTGAALYLEITEFALEKVIPMYKNHGIPVSMEGTAACIATLYIQANR